MSRAVEEWIGKHDDSKVPPRVRRKPIGVPITIQYFRDRSVVNATSGCWEWTGAMQWNGYGAVKMAGKTTRAHRAAFIVCNGISLDSSMDICHHCDNRRCVNPDHLFVGTRTDNMRDCANKGRVVLPALFGEQCPAAKLTEAQVLAIRQDARSQREIARSYGVDKGTIAHIQHRKTWRHI